MHLTYLRGAHLDGVRVSPSDDIRTAMNRMNASGRTFVVVVDHDGVLTGVMADGDIRRYLAAGGAIDGLVGEAANRTPTVLPSSSSTAEVSSLMIRRGLEYLPLVDGDRLHALVVLEHVARSNDLSAVVLAGGLGKRLAPLTATCPKPLLPLGDRPILSHILDHLRSHGIHRFVFSVGYLAEMIVDYYDNGSRWGSFIEYVRDGKRLGTAGPLGLVPLESLSDPFLVTNGDILNDIDVGALLETHVSNGWDATMVVRQHSYTVPYGVVKSAADGSFVEVAEKPVLDFQINGGVYLMSKAALGVIPKDHYYDMTTMFDDLPKAGLRGGVYLHTGRWIDIGGAAEYERAQQIFEARVTQDDDVADR
ncbi:nucleotidyltransferase family protein [Jatrophihabitans fulvus]